MCFTLHGTGHRPLSHRPADATAHKRCGPIAAFVAPQFTLQSQCGNTFLAGAHQIDGEQPFVERNSGVLKDGSHRDGALPAAAFAFVDARPQFASGFDPGLQSAHGYGATVRTYRTSGPASPFEVLTGGGRILKVWWSHHPFRRLRQLSHYRRESAAICIFSHHVKEAL